MSINRASPPSTAPPPNQLRALQSTAPFPISRATPHQPRHLPTICPTSPCTSRGGSQPAICIAPQQPRNVVGSALEHGVEISLNIFFSKTQSRFNKYLKNSKKPFIKSWCRAKTWGFCIPRRFNKSVVRFIKSRSSAAPQASSAHDSRTSEVKGICNWVGIGKVADGWASELVGGAWGPTVEGWRWVNRSVGRIELSGWSVGGAERGGMGLHQSVRWFQGSPMPS